MYGLKDLTDRQHFNLSHSIDIQSIPEPELLSKRWRPSRLLPRKVNLQIHC